MPDHIHILFGLRPSQSIADLMQDIKGSSSKCPPDQSGRDQRQKVYSWQVFMARGLWGIFL
jgi:REP element-mobilizing transposase RayT